MNKAFFFGDAAHESEKMYGILSSPESRSTKAIGIIICHAFSEERQKSYRSTYLFSQLAADSGFPCLRFDYRGTGDSSGSLEDVTIDTMIHDTIRAHQFAQDSQMTKHWVLLGVRLGAVVALNAAKRISGACGVIAWNPIIDGKRYFRDLTRTETIISLASRKDARTPETTVGNGTEVDAEFLSEAMTGQLKEIDILTTDLPQLPYFLTSQENDKIEKRNVDRLEEKMLAESLTVTSWKHETSDFWSPRSMHDAFYPTATFDATIDWMKNIQRQIYEH